MCTSSCESWGDKLACQGQLPHRSQCNSVPCGDNLKPQTPLWPPGRSLFTHVLFLLFVERPHCPSAGLSPVKLFTKETSARSGVPAHALRHTWLNSSLPVCGTDTVSSGVCGFQETHSTCISRSMVARAPAEAAPVVQWLGEWVEVPACSDGVVL